ncbi:PKD domain-containing protein [Candidatus Parcubacteria bacterium]|jgi:PKD repeat protein|nr:PKD domain-containing protein [Candidatus Parcubacteria bacterium]
MKKKAIVLTIVFLFCSKAQASTDDLVFSEIMYDAVGADSGHEWVEIFNGGDQDLVASSTWRFFDGSNHSLNLYHGSSTILVNDYFVVADNAENFLLDYPDFSGNLFDSVMSLPNSSSTLGLSFDSGQNYPLEFFYDSVLGGESGYSLQLNTSTNVWQASQILGGSPGEENIFVEEEAHPEEEIFDWSQIIVSEFIPNPVGSDDEEWIELYNRGVEDINLEGFSLQDNSVRKFTLDLDTNIDLLLPSNGYKILYKNITGISLNNSSGDSVKLYDPDDNILETISYTNALEGRSYARQDNVFFWTKNPTPGSDNDIVVNQAPTAQIVVENGDFIVGEKISFSAKNSSDPEGDELDFKWDFGDGDTSSKETIKHKFDNVGAYTIILRIEDSEGLENRSELSINITRKIEEIEQINSTEQIIEIVPIDFGEDDLIISEFIPNPVGSDDNEWIEIYNASAKDIDLRAWRLDDQDGGSKPYLFSSSTIVSADDFLVVQRSVSKITLNNSTDSVRLITPAEELWQEVVYEKIPEGKSYAWDLSNSEWLVSDPMPEQKNILVLEKMEEIILSTAEVKDFAKKDKVLTQGVVITPADDKTKSFYIAGWQAGETDFENILEIYSYHKNFPELKIGQVVMVVGEISKTGYLPRVKISSREDISINDVLVDLVEPEITEVENIDEDFLGGYLRIRGVVVKKSGKNIYLGSDIEEDYILRAYSNFSTKELEIKKGLEVIIKGILTETDSGFKILPQNLADLWVSQQVLAEKIHSSQSLEELEINTSTNFVDNNDNKNQVKQTLLFLLVGSIVIVVMMVVKRVTKKSSR